ncbi:cation diffusion facilitator family transporter [Sphingomonas sp. 1P08PE]|uniref:cation diffusion facilitator family transporter n=1 Tax=Sphingomonas sp. 1P08PE TaxID=554122 RepID=UPI0039A3CE78
MASTSLGKTIRSNIVLFGALFANVGIAVAKFVAAGFTGSSSMLSEGFHSLVDSGNQILLLYGQRQAKRPPDARHPFGYGRELYFWAFVVAILIFALGAGISFYEGWLHIREPEPLADPTINYVVLGIATLLEGSSWTIAVREFRQSKGDLGWWAAIKESKDPASFIVLFEDSAALAGLMVAAIGIWASHAMEDPRIDGVASIVIGVILAAVAVLLAREAKGLLIGERADPRVVERVRALVAASEGVVAVNHVRTIHTAPDAVFVAISADFDDRLTMGEGEALIERIEAQLRAEFPDISSIYVRPERAAEETARAEQRRSAPAAGDRR